MPKVLDLSKWQTRRVHAHGIAKYDVGDLVWVKEGLVAEPEDIENSNVVWTAYECGDKMTYGSFPLTEDGFAIDWPWSNRTNLPAMYCPRWASRVTLKITRVRRQDVRRISYEDAIAEGFGCEDEFLDYFMEICPEFRRQNNEGQFPFYVHAYDFEVVK